MDWLKEMNDQIINCTQCPRLVEYRQKVAREKVRRYKDHEYWGRPVPSFGDPAAELFIIGLAPGTHGANRTGRMFTGDDSGNWLFQALYETGFANQPHSQHRQDGLYLYNTFISSIVRCVPPKNKPKADEIHNCSIYLKEELRQMENIKVILTLGRLAFKQYCRIAQLKGIEFGHHKVFNINDKLLISSYHPSRQNTNTGRLTWEAWLKVFEQISQQLNEKKFA